MNETTKKKERSFVSHGCAHLSLSLSLARRARNLFCLSPLSPATILDEGACGLDATLLQDGALDGEQVTSPSPAPHNRLRALRPRLRGGEVCGPRPARPGRARLGLFQCHPEAWPSWPWFSYEGSCGTMVQEGRGPFSGRDVALLQEGGNGALDRGTRGDEVAPQQPQHLY